MGLIRQLGRTVLSYLPRMGLLPKPRAYRPEGVSAMMTVKDEEDWIRKSVLSIADVVDEMVVVDNGSEDATYSILSDLERQLGGKLRLYRFPTEDFCAAVNFTLDQTKYKWILRWHGDFVARTTGPYSTRGMLNRVRLLDSHRYYCVWIGPVSLDGDLFHQIPEKDVEREPFIFSYHPRLRYRQVGRFEVLQVPYFYKRLDWKELYFFHMRYVKPAKRILYRFFWTEWMAYPDKRRFPTLDSFVRHRIQQEYGTSDLKEAMRRRIADLAGDLAPYDRARYGEYPALISDDLRNPKYRLIYENGRIVSRSDIEEAPEG